MSPTAEYDHLVHFASHDELRLYELIPNRVWVFDLDKHGWWWGNSAAVEFWGLAALEQPISVGHHRARVGASVGIARYPDDGQELDGQLKAADRAMYAVKNSGKNGFVFAR